MKPFPIPIRSELESGIDALEAVQYLEMPQSMRTWSPSTWPDSPNFHGQDEVLDILARLAQLLEDQLHQSEDRSHHGAAPGAGLQRRYLSLTGLSEEGRRSLDQVLGEGEVSARVLTQAGLLLVQETVFAGIWRLRQQDEQGNFCSEGLEVARFPKVLLHPVPTSTPFTLPTQAAPVPENLLCGPALLSEINARIQSPASHIINLTLLPYTPEDGLYLDQCLGRAHISALSRGYGNCRITATRVPRVWWVQFFNSQATLILNTIEITEVPEAMVAAKEDLEDSQERLVELIQWLEQS